MKAQNIHDFSKQLLASERLGCKAVREICNEALVKWGSNWESLVILSNLFLQGAERGCDRADNDLSGTYLLLYHETLDYARQHLTRGDFHRFCERSERSSSRALWA